MDTFLAILAFPLILLSPLLVVALIAKDEPDLYRHDDQQECRDAGGVPALRHDDRDGLVYDGCLAGQPGVTFTEVRP